MSVAIEKLRERVPDDLIKQRRQGGATLDYLEWHAAAALLDDRAPGWSCQIKQVGEIGGKVFVIVAITIDGVTRENIGFEEEAKSGYGDPFSNSFAMSFKRTAALFGLARHLYNKDDKRQPEARQYPRQAASSHSDAAPQRAAKAPQNDIILDSQVYAITNIGKMKKIDVHAYAMEQFSKPVTALSGEQAADMIRYLNGVKA